MRPAISCFRKGHSTPLFGAENTSAEEYKELESPTPSQLFVTLAPKGRACWQLGPVLLADIGEKTVSLEYPAHCQNKKKKGSCLSSDPEPASPFSLLGMQQFSAGLVLPPRDRSLLQLLSCLPLCHHLPGFPPPQHAPGRVQPPPSCPTMASPSTETPGPRTAAPVPAAQQQNCSQHGTRATWVSKCCHRPSAFSSARASRPPHQPAGFAEGLLLTADTFGLTVNNKTKSLCTALQTLLHPPGCTAELQDRVGDLCSTLHTECSTSHTASLLATSASL